MFTSCMWAANAVISGVRTDGPRPLSALYVLCALLYAHSAWCEFQCQQQGGGK
jgi:hypothetical protein